MLKQTFVFLTCLALSAAPAAESVKAGAVATTSHTGAAASTRTLFESMVAENKVPGVSGSFGRRGEPTIFLSSGTIADRKGAPAASPDTLWRLYSMGKPITGLAAMLLVEDGKLGLDQPVADFIPAFRNMRVLIDPAGGLATRPARGLITVRQLMTHTSGMTYHFGSSPALGQEYLRLGITPYQISRPDDLRLRAHRPKSLQAFAVQAAKLPLFADPGTTWEYSIGLDVLAAVVEKAAGMPYQQFLRTRLLKPLRMSSTFFTVPGAEARRLADNVGYEGDEYNPPSPALLSTTGTVRRPLDRGPTSVYLHPPSFPYGGAGMVSSARDIDRLLQMLQNDGELDGARVMKPETVRLALSNLMPPGLFFYPGASAGIPQDRRIRLGFGAGGFVTLESQRGGLGKGSFSWMGAAGTVMFVDPENGLRGSMMINFMPSEQWPLRDEFYAAIEVDGQRR